MQQAQVTSTGGTVGDLLTTIFGAPAFAPAHRQHTDFVGRPHQILDVLSYPQAPVSHAA